MHIHDERALLALQGPKAVAAVQVRGPRRRFRLPRRLCA